MDSVLEALDPALIWMYRLTGYPVPDFFLGTLLLALLAVVVGEYTISIAYRANRRHIEGLSEDVVNRNEEALEALRRGDKARWKRRNRRANDAFGRMFFQQIALSAASLWPAFIALGWMQTRFIGLEFPLPGGGFGLWGGTVGYVFVFVLSYILARILFDRVKWRLPWFRAIKPMLDRQAERARTFSVLPGDGSTLPRRRERERNP